MELEVPSSRYDVFRVVDVGQDSACRPHVGFWDPMRFTKDELGVRDPVCFWDPLGFSADGNAERFHRRRQTDLKHGGISMLATISHIVLGQCAQSPHIMRLRATEGQDERRPW